MKKKALNISILASTLFGLTIPTYAQSNNEEATEKDEVIYALLDHGGQVDELYVTNIFEVSEQTNLVDYGTYESIDIMNTQDDMDYDGEKISIETEENRLFTQGYLDDSHSLPWTFELVYRLDGEVVHPEEVEGESGELSVYLDISPTDVEDAHLMEFFDHYMLEVSTSMYHLTHFNLESEDGIIATSGNQREIQWTVLPEEGDLLSFHADTTDFEKLSWEINAVPFSMEVDEERIELDDMTEMLDSLESGIAETAEGASELQSGTAQLQSGLAEFQTGIETLETGVGELNAMSGPLEDGSAQLLSALSSLNQEVQDISIDINELYQLLEAFELMQSRLNSGIETIGRLESTVENVLSQLDNPLSLIERNDQASEYLSYIENNLAEYNELLVEEDLVDSEEMEKALHYVKDNITENTNIIDRTARVYGELQEFAGEAQAITDDLSAAQNELQAFHSGLETVVNRLVALDQYVNELQTGMNAIVSSAAELDSGIQEYTDGVSELSAGMQEAISSITQLSQGAQELNQGALELAEGSNELREETTDLSGQAEEQIFQFIEDFTNPHYEPSSFVDERNNIENSQFVIQIHGEEEQAEDEEPVEEEEDDRSIWQRFLDLFK